jgi:hypothetical protein
MSRPISAMSTWAAVRPTPESSSNWSTGAASGAGLLVDRGREGGDVDAALVDAGQHGGQQEPVMVAEGPPKASSNTPSLARRRPRASWASTLGSHAQLDLGVLKQPAPRGASRQSGRRPDQPGRGPGSREPADLGGCTKLGRSSCRSATLASHTASRRSVLGRPGRCSGVAGVDQPGRKPVPSSREHAGSPGRLHHHPGHPQLPQPVRHGQPRPRHRGVGPHLLPSAGPACPGWAPGHHRPAPLCRSPGPRPAG